MALPIKAVTPASLNAPGVQKNVVAQRVDLRPAGNTVAITVKDANPFSANAPLRIYTQASGGMAKPDAKQQSNSGPKMFASYLDAPNYMDGLGASEADFNERMAAVDLDEASKIKSSAGARSNWQRYWSELTATQQQRFAATHPETANAIAASYGKSLSSLVNLAQTNEAKQLAQQGKGLIKKAPTGSSPIPGLDMPQMFDTSVPAKAGLPKWVLPVAIGAGALLLLGGFFLMKKKSA
jgi:hypothetical protein